jgi:hypothetical protein
MLSIGKLSHLARLHEAEAAADEKVLDGMFPSFSPFSPFFPCDLR